MDLIKGHGDKFKDRKLSFILDEGTEVLSSISDFAASGFVFKVTDWSFDFIDE
jgi:hypothetical protein